MREPFPLDWPEGWTRTKPGRRSRARFDGGYGLAKSELLYELGKLSAANIVITSNIRLSSNGVPDGRSDGALEDPGVAVWWMQKGGVERVMACDRWRMPGENMRAIAKSLEALRGIDRWGASQIVDRAFAAFNALPAGGETHSVLDWWETLDINPELLESLSSEDLLAIVGARYRKMAGNAHPDRGGSADEYALLNMAYETAQTYCKNK